MRRAGGRLFNALRSARLLGRELRQNMKHPRKYSVTMRRSGVIKSAPAGTRNKRDPIRYDPADRRRALAGAVHFAQMQQPTLPNSNADCATPPDLDVLPDATIVQPRINAKVRVTQTFTGATDEQSPPKTGTKAHIIPSVQDARISPIAVLITCRTQTAEREKKYRAKLYQTVAAAYAAYYEIERSNDLWKEFASVAKACEAFKRPVRLGKDRDKALLLVMRFVFGWSHDYDRAYKLARGLELYQLAKLAPEQILARLQQDGIENLYKAACKKLPYWGKSAKEKAYMRMGFEPTAAIDSFGDLDDGSNDDTVSSGAINSTEFELESELKRGGRHVFCVEVDDEQLATILAAPEHQRLSVWFESVGALTDGLAAV